MTVTVNNSLQNILLLKVKKDLHPMAWDLLFGEYIRSGPIGTYEGDTFPYNEGDIVETEIQPSDASDNDSSPFKTPSPARRQRNGPAPAGASPCHVRRVSEAESLAGPSNKRGKFNERIQKCMARQDTTPDMSSRSIDMDDDEDLISAVGELERGMGSTSPQYFAPTFDDVETHYDDFGDGLSTLLGDFGQPSDSGASGQLQRPARLDTPR